MKTIIKFIFILSSVICYPQVGIGTTNPDASSVLDIVSTDSGVLIPRLTVAQRINITNPAEGLLVYQTDDINGFYYFNNTQWIRLGDNPRDSVPVGAIFAFPTASPPTGYLECDGSAVSRTTYANLFALIGTTYGAGNGSTTFNLPDYRGQFLRGFNNGATNDPDAVTRLDRGDGTTGDNVGTIQNNETLSHLHGVDPPSTNSSGSGNHSHTIPPRTFYSSGSGAHNHNIGAFTVYTNQSGNHNHTLSYNNRTVGNGTPSTTIREFLGPTGYSTSNSGYHNHQVYIPARLTAASGSHNHSIYINNLYTNGVGAHVHALNIASFNSSNSGGNETRPTNVSVMWCIKY